MPNPTPPRDLRRHLARPLKRKCRAKKGGAK
jgi:hypothetical protein